MNPYRKALNVLVVLALVVLALPFQPIQAYASTWGSLNGYAYSMKFYANTTNSTGANITANLVNFPTNVSLNATNFNFGLVRPDLNDIRFLAQDDTTVLNTENASWDSVAQIANFWVSCNWTANSTTQYITMYYGNPAAIADWNTQAVWSNTNAVGVYHFDPLSGNLTANSANASNKCR